MRFGRRSFGFSAAAIIAALTSLMSMEAFEPIRPSPSVAAKRRRLTGCYPHSSMRQQARYARQVAAGQLSMTIVEKRV